MEYTKGEWKIWNDEIIAFGENKEDRSPICKIYHNHHDSEAYSNAKLIERAPKMYEACCFVAVQLEERGWVDSELVGILNEAIRGL